MEAGEKLREVLVATDDFFRARLDQMIDLRHPSRIFKHFLLVKRFDSHGHV